MAVKERASEPLPKLILIADGFTDLAVAPRIIEAVAAGVPWVQLRDHAAGEATFARSAERLVHEMRRLSPGIVISVNGRLPVAKALGTGFHTGKRGSGIHEALLDPAASRGPVGYSAHDVEEAEEMARLGPDYLFASPVFPTMSKPGQEGMGTEGLRAFTRSVAVPVFALGGVTPETVPHCLDAEAYGVAVLGGILRASDPGAAVQAYLATLRAHTLERRPDVQIQR
ncbi:MAG TPA: thiamine phosphate synthase [Rhodothermales bacterium]|nr:thiamine phosphate synthase [Rhodothermales bacterium]